MEIESTLRSVLGNRGVGPGPLMRPRPVTNPLNWLSVFLGSLNMFALLAIKTMNANGLVYEYSSVDTSSMWILM